MASSEIEYEKPVQQSQQNSVNERRRAALREIDEADFGWFHAKACLVAGVGFFTDAYDVFAISIAATMLGRVYSASGTLTANQDLGIKVAAPVGTLIGQLLFGWLADVFGRKKLYGIELMIIMVGTIGQSVAGHGPGVSIIGVLVMWRFFMGLGIGGDYPLSATITSEFATTRTRGRMMAAVFSAQGWGNFGAALVGFICVSGFKHQIINDNTSLWTHVDYSWRILIGLGAVPGAIALYFRLTIPETPRFTMDIERNVQQAAQDVETCLSTGGYTVDPEAPVVKVQAPKASLKDFMAYNGQWKNGKILLGCAWSWFALDIAFYGLGLNSSIVLTAVGFGGASPAGSTAGYKAWKKLNDVCVGNLILSAGGLLPGYWASILTIDSWGRKPIQYMGFVMLTLIFCVMGFAYDAMQATSSGKKAFIFLYCLANFFQNFGPNTTTFIIPGESFPTRYRSTSHGISAASGKLGAIVAQVGFAQLKDIGGPNAFVKHILEIFAFFMLTGIFSTYLVPETKGRSLEDISNEDQDDFVQAPSRNALGSIPVPQIF